MLKKCDFEAREATGAWRWDSSPSCVVRVLSLFISEVGAALVGCEEGSVTTWGHGSSDVDVAWR